MFYRIYLISLIIILLTLSPAHAQDVRYRVEILVLTHLHSSEEPADRPFIEDYSAAVDFLTPVEEEEEPEESPPAVELAEQPSLDPELPAEPEDEEEEDPNALVHIEQMSDVMQDAWRRLRLSAPFRPEQYLSWEQGSEPPFPELRVHDLEPVRTDDPWAEQRRELEEAEAEKEEERRAAGEPDPIFTSPAGMDGLEPEEEPGLPDPIVFYRLDGTAMLRRTRFLHLDLALQLREPVWEEQEPAPIPPAGAVEEYEPPPPSSYLVHDLKQSRQVKTARMEYFDGPVLSVLAYITSIEIEAEDTAGSE